MFEYFRSMSYRNLVDNVVDYWPHLKIEIFQTRKQKMSKFVPEKVSFASILSLHSLLVLLLSPMFSIVIYRNNFISYSRNLCYGGCKVNKQKKNKIYCKWTSIINSILNYWLPVNKKFKVVPS